jgi:hypothetical protein
MTLQQRNLDAITGKKYDRLANQTAPQKPESLGFYAGWDATRNLHKIVTVRGDTYWGNPLSTGSAGTGDAAAIQIDSGSRIAAFKVTPR